MGERGKRRNSISALINNLRVVPKRSWELVNKKRKPIKKATSHLSGRWSQRKRGAGHKPSSVPGRPGDDHSSRTPVARGLQRPTRELQAGHLQALPYLVLLRVGFSKPAVSPLPLVSSYLTFSPLPWRAVREPPLQRRNQAVWSLWHFPWGCPRWGLPSTLPCGARTFLRRHDAQPAIIWPAPRPFEICQTPSGNTAVWSLRHFPWGCPRWGLPSTLPCGARTFLRRHDAQPAIIWPAPRPFEICKSWLIAGRFENRPYNHSTAMAAFGQCPDWPVHPPGGFRPGAHERSYRPRSFAARFWRAATKGEGGGP